MILVEVLNGVDYSIKKGSDSIDVSDIVYDSRKVTPGCLFVCLSGANANGHDFVYEAVDKGAVAVLSEDEIECGCATLVCVRDTREALAYISASFFGHPANKLITIGITGTKGKTTTAFMIRDILEHSGIKTGMIGTVGIFTGKESIKSNNTTPESYEVQKAFSNMVENGCKCVVMEASSLGLKYHRVDGFTFDYGVFTNLAPDHIGRDEHDSMEDYVSSKALLFQKCKHGFVNIDDVGHEKVLTGCTCPVNTFGFSRDADFFAKECELVSRSGYLGIRFKLDGKVEDSIKVSMPGKFNVYNALAAISICLSMDIGMSSIKSALARIKIKGRTEFVPIPWDYTMIIDFAHNALSMKSVLTTLREYNPTRIITLFGSGGDRSKDRRHEMGEISGKLSDLSVVTEDNPRTEDIKSIVRDIKNGLDKVNGKYVIIEDRSDAIKYCMDVAKPGDIVLLAGKGHEDYQIFGHVKVHFDEREVIDKIINIKEETGE